LYITTDVGVNAYGGHGNDNIYAEFGGYLYGGAGDDTLQADNDDVVMNGGPGADTFVCTEGADEEIEDYNAEEGDIIQSQELCWRVS
jgi:Ca2+-binding RTX toxin-like protein